MKLKSLRHPSTAAKHLRLEAAAQFSPLSEWDLDDIDYVHVLTGHGNTNPADHARRERDLRADLNPSEE